MAARTVVLSERADEGELEQPLGVGLGFTSEAGELRQTGAHEHDRQVELGRAVYGGDQSSQLGLAQVLDLVDGQ